MLTTGKPHFGSTLGTCFVARTASCEGPPNRAGACKERRPWGTPSGVPSSKIPIVDAATARQLLLGAQGLLDDPTRRADKRAVKKLVHALGYVQVDSINAVGERAHHLTLHTRLDAYRPRVLQTLIEKDRALFEHWTHDASVIPVEWYPHWKVRFQRFRREGRIKSWCTRRMGGDPARVIRRVRARLRADGPLMARDFEQKNALPDESGGWWNWHPEKAALEYLWRSGEVCIAARRGFQRVFQLSADVLPEQHAQRASTPSAHLEFACGEAFQRLVVATPSEVARYFAAAPLTEVRRYCARATKRGWLIEVEVHAEDGGKPQRALALPDYAERARALRPAPQRTRLLSPFDPVVRDRARAARLFAFNYRFEAFVPEAKRKYGYYVMPILDDDRIVGRIEPKLDRDAGVLRVHGLWWERGANASVPQRRRLRAALERLAELLGADQVVAPGLE